jgi:integrase
MDVSLAKNRSGVWEVRWSEQLPDGSWRSRTRSTKMRSRPDAEMYRDAFANGGTPPPPPTIEDLCKLYLKLHVEAQGNSDSQTYALLPIRKFFGRLFAADLTPELIEDFRLSRNVSDGTARRELGALVAVLNWAARARKIQASSVPHIPLPATGCSRAVWLNEEQEAEYYAFAMGDSVGRRRLTRTTRYVALALDTAARRGAIQGLTWDRVDLRAGIIDYRVPGQKQTKKRRVPVPISDRLAPILERAWTEAASPFVIDPGSIRAEIVNWFATSPHPHIRTHDMRRTWATLAARAGVDLWEIAGVLGDTIEVVTRHYAHHCPGHLRAAVNKRWS